MYKVNNDIYKDTDCECVFCESDLFSVNQICSRNARRFCGKVKISYYIAQYPIFGIAQSAFYTLLPGKPVQSKTTSASLGSIQSRGNFAKTARTQIVITVCSQVLIHTAE